MTLYPRRSDVTPRPPHTATPAYALDAQRWFARCSSCDWTGDLSDIEAEALADSEGHRRASRFGRLL